MNLENLSPFALRRSIASASDEDGLVDAASHLPRVFVALLDAGLPAADVGRVLSLQSDSVTERLIDLTIERRGPPPAQWAWLALGSVARRELTLASDQDNALAYEDSQDRGAVDSYFKQPRGGRQRRTCSLRFRGRQRRGSGAEPRVAHVAVRMARDLRLLPRDTGPFSPRAGSRVL